MSARLQRYELVRTIARGGMATVWEAVAHGADGFRRKVALKRILPELAADESMRRMFLDEARIASGLHHGNIVQIIDYGLVDDGPFLVMELVDGVSARHACTARPPSLGIALHMAAEIAHALEHLAEAEDADGAPLGIVHRDLSPHNVLLSWDGDVKLGDFGVAFARVRDEQTEAGVVKGKRAYMAPEQAAGGAVSSASDVFSLGATLCWFLTGATEEDALDDIEDEDARALVESCLAASPEARPSAAEVAARAGKLAAAHLERDARGAMRSWLASVERKSTTLDDLMGMALVPDAAGGYTLSRAEPPSASHRRWAISIAAIVAIVAIVVLGGALAWWVTRDPPTAEREEPARTETPHESPVLESTMLETPMHEIIPVRESPPVETPMSTPMSMTPEGIRIDRNIDFDD